MKSLICKLLTVTLVFMLGFLDVHAQEKKPITGMIQDSTGNGIAGVSITEKGTKNAVATAANGSFKINVAPGATLVATSVNYQTHEFKVGDQSSYNIVMQAKPGILGEVIVSAFGISKQKRNLGYAQDKVKTDDIIRASSASPISALQGKVAGVNINVMGASGVQSSPSIMIRGAKSLRQGNNQAMFVIDGNVIQNNTYDADGVDQGSQLKNLNPDDYESITVLKGAAATAIYGSRGANGAIVITTKKGKASKGLGVTFNSSYTVDKIYRNGIGLQNEYGSGSAYFREGNFLPDGTQTFTSNSYGPKFDGSLHPAIHNNSLMVPYVAQPDNWKTFYQDGVYIDNNISLSGGSDKVTYRLSYSNLNNKGTLVNNKIERNAFNFRTTGQINNIFSIEGGASYAMSTSLNAFGQGRYFWPTGSNVGFMTYYATPRNTDLAAWRNDYRNPDGSMKNYGYGLYTNQVNATFNRFDNRNDARYEKSLLTDIMLKAQVNNWIDFSVKANFNNYKIFNETKEKGSGAFGAGGYYGVGGEYSSTYDYVAMAHAAKTAFNDNLDIDVRLIGEMYGNGKSESYSANTDGGLIVPNVFTLSNSVNNIRDTRRYSFTRPNNKVMGAGAIVNLGWKDYLNLELTARNDWMSSLTYPENVPGANNFSVFYPSANASFSFSELWKEKMPSWLNFGKIRASLAYVGNGTDPFATSFGSYKQGVVTNINGQSVITSNLNNADVLPNLDLKPEKQRSLELGTYLSFLGDKINFDFAWYKTNTYNQILTIPGVLETGFNKRRINAGDIQNKGIEISIDATPVRKKNLTWNVAANFSRNRGKINKFYPGITTYALMGDYDGAGVYAYEGGSFGMLTANYGGSWRKYDATTGLPLIKVADEYNGNGAVFQEYEWVNESFDATNPRKNIGNVEPDFLAGFNTSVRWKQFTLFAQLDSRIGGWIYSESFSYGMQRGNVIESLKYRDQAHGGVARTDSYTGQTVYDGAIPDAVFDAGEVSPITGVSIAGMTFAEAYKQGLIPAWKAASYNVNTYGWGTNFDAGAASELSWIMLREVSLSYQLPKSVISKVKLKSASLRFTGRNLGYLYNNLSADQNPASLQSNNPFNPVIAGAVPFSRNWSIALNISF